MERTNLLWNCSFVVNIFDEFGHPLEIAEMFRIACLVLQLNTHNKLFDIATCDKIIKYDTGLFVVKFVTVALTETDQPDLQYIFYNMKCTWLTYGCRLSATVRVDQQHYTFCDRWVLLALIEVGLLQGQHFSWRSGLVIPALLLSCFPKCHSFVCIRNLGSPWECLQLVYPTLYRLGHSIAGRWRIRSVSFSSL